MADSPSSQVDTMSDMLRMQPSNRAAELLVAVSGPLGAFGATLGAALLLRQRVSVPEMLGATRATLVFLACVYVIALVFLRGERGIWSRASLRPMILAGVLGLLTTIAARMRDTVSTADVVIALTVSVVVFGALYARSPRYRSMLTGEEAKR